jgi:hypothetical protein
VKARKKQRLCDVIVDGIDTPNEECGRPSEPDNAVLKIVRDAFERRGFTGVYLMRGNRIADESKETWFSPEDLQKLGRLLLNAISAGDIDFADTVREAINGADALFHRDRERELHSAFFRFMCDYPQPYPTVGVLRREFAERYNHGKPLEDHQWKRLRRSYPALLEAGKAGRPRGKKSGTRT